MKLATWKDGSRDGQLVVVSHDLATAHFASGRAATLQQVLDDWNFLSPQLQELSLTLDAGQARHAFAFDPRCCMAPLPRAFQWVFAGAAGSQAAQRLAGDCLLGPCDPVFAQAGVRLLAEPGLAVITGDIERGTSPDAALETVRLLALCCVWQQGAAAASGEGRDRSPVALAGPDRVMATGFAPVVLTPDEVAPAWRDGQLQGGLAPGRRTRAQDADGEAAAAWAAGELLTLLCRQQPVRAGAMVGMSCQGASSPGGMPGLVAGETARVEWRTPDGSSPFGAIEQPVQMLDAALPRSRFG